MSELFPIDQVAKDSPRVVWMKRYVVQVKDDAGSRNGGKLAFSQNNPQWSTGYGITEDAAINDFASKNKINLWHEGEQTPVPQLSLL